jgi:hypothetical protein
VVKAILVRIILVSICLVFVASSGLEAQEGFGVDLDVVCEDVELRSLVRSFFSRDLRELGDVRVAEMAAPNFRIDVIAEIARRNWTLSIIITAPFHPSQIEGSDEETAAALKGYAKPIKHLLVKGDSTDDLSREIGDIVKDLDREVFKPLRKASK